MKVLSSVDLDSVAIHLKKIISERYPFYKAHMHFLYFYGVRIGELFNNSIHFDSPAGKLIVYPQKNNNPRILSIINDKTIKYVDEIQLRSDLLYLNKRNLQRIIIQEMQYRNLKCGKKNINAHLFRHNYVKKLVADGLQYSTIDHIMGYTTQSVTDTYAISKIYY